MHHIGYTDTDRNPTKWTDDGLLIICITLLIIFFAGEPDIADKFIGNCQLESTQKVMP
jgi:hypothetical protein